LAGDVTSENQQDLVGQRLEVSNQVSAASADSTEFTPKALLATATGFVALFCNVGLTVWGLPFYYDFMVKEYGWSRARVTSGNAISKVVIGLAFGFLAGWLVDRFGVRKLMLAGTLMTGCALVGLGSISTIGTFYFFYMFVALGYVCGGPLPNQVLLSRWFTKSRGKAMGIAYLGIGLGGAVSPWISHFLVQHFDWHSALKILGLILIGIALPLAYFVKEPEVPRAKQQAVLGVKASGAFRSPYFYLLMLASMLSISAVAGTQQNLKLFLSLDQHFSQSDSTRILSLVLTFSIGGRLLMGWLADLWPKKYVMLLIYSLVACALPLLFVSGSRAPLYLFAVVFGIALGGEYMIVPLMTAEIFGAQFLGRLLGVLLAADGFADALSPWWIGHMRDVHGNYFRGFMTLVCMALAGAVAIMALPKRGIQA
jgi:MFS family permease